MSFQGKESVGPGRIRAIITELFDLLVVHGKRMESQTAIVARDEAIGKLTSICLECRPGTDQEPDPDCGIDFAPPAPASKPGEQRKFFLLRMVSCKLSHLFDTVNNSRPLDRQCSHGIDAYMRRIFKAGVYDDVNERAGQILGKLGRGDASILSAIYDNPGDAAFLENVLVRICLSMAKYPNAKDALISELNQAQTPDAPTLGHDEFRAIIGSLLSDVFLLGRTSSGGDRLDYRYGRNAAAAISQVADLYGKDT